MTRVEALVDAFSKMNGWHDPFSEAYRIRNPMMLRAFSPKHVKNENGYRVFNSFSSGYDNGVIDLKIKCSGKSNSRLTPESTLNDLVQCYGNPASATRYIKKFLRHALDDMNIMESTPLSFFMADQPAQKENINDVKP